MPFERDAHEEHEALVVQLNDAEERRTYAAPFDHYPIALIPCFLGKLLVGTGDLVYGKAPSYEKFRAIEVIARVPYHSWSSAAFTMLTLYYQDEARALRLTRLARYASLASDNETMHVVVISCLARVYAHVGRIRNTLVPIIFGFFYFWATYLLYLLRPAWSLELNYLFEDHAYKQYSLFLSRNEEILKCRPIESTFLAAYGRTPRSQYEFFEGVRNDELIHRNRSMRERQMHRERGR